MKTIKEMMNLNGRTALITGCCGRLGSQMALTIAELGGDLILLDKPKADFDEVTTKIRKISEVEISLIECDLEDELSIKESLKKIIENREKLEVLINNAAFVGLSNLDGWNSKFNKQSLKTWNRALSVNLTAIFQLSKELSPIIKDSGNGTIINMSSIYGFKGPDYSLYEGTTMGSPAAYSVSKGGVIQLTRWLAKTLSPEVRVNCISPGGVFSNQPKDFVNNYEKKTPLNRMASPNDIKGITAYLSTDLSEYVTGQNFVIDGGWSV